MKFVWAVCLQVKPVDNIRININKQKNTNKEEPLTPELSRETLLQPASRILDLGCMLALIQQQFT